MPRSTSLSARFLLWVLRTGGHHILTLYFKLPINHTSDPRTKAWEENILENNL